MARFGDVVLVDEHSAGSSAVFLLKAPVDKSTVFETDGWEVVVQNGSRAVVVRGPAQSSYAEVRSEGLRAASRALDLLCIRGVAYAHIERPADFHVVTFVEQDRIVLRIVSHATMLVVVESTITARDAEGMEISRTVDNDIGWHESFTYFRYSQLTDDLFDAYRNISLAIESVLSSIAPQRRGEREKAWLSRAWEGALALGVDAKVLRVDTPVEKLRKSRNDIMHAKRYRDVLSFSDWGDRAKVHDDLRWLADLYLELVYCYLGFRKPGGGLVQYGIQQALRVFDRDLRIQCSDDASEFRRDDTRVNPAGGKVADVGDLTEVSSDDAAMRSVLGGARPSNLLPIVRRVGLSLEDGQAFAVEVLPQELDPSGVDRIEVLMGVRIRNAAPIKTTYLL